MHMIKKLVSREIFFFSLTIITLLIGFFLIFKIIAGTIEVGTKSLYLLLAAAKTIVFLISSLFIFAASVSLFFSQYWSAFLVQKKEFVKNILTLAITCIILLLFIEGMVRITDGFTQSKKESYRTTDNIIHHAFIPNSSGVFTTPEWNVSYKINKYGLRDYEYDLTKKNTTRILMLGDSFIEGYGVELDESVSKVLEKKLNSGNTHQKYQVINGGTSSYSPLLEYLYLKNKGLELKPDIVILNLDLLDISNDVEYTQKAIFDENMQVIAVQGNKREQSVVEKGMFGIFFSLRVVQKIKNLYDHLIFYQLPLFFDKRLNNAINTENILIDPYVISRTDNLTKYDKEINLTKEYIKDIADLSENNNITFILHIFPRPHQVSPTEWKSRTLNGFNLGEVYSTKVLEEFERFAQENDIKVINSMDYFKNTTETNVFFDYDYHWTKKGHKIAATALYDYLAREKIAQEHK